MRKKNSQRRRSGRSRDLRAMWEVNMTVPLIRNRSSARNKPSNDHRDPNPQLRPLDLLLARQEVSS
jgi:hypothetical protein